MSSVRFVDNSEKVKKDVKRLRDIALTESAVAVQGNCVALCPRETGHLQGSIGYITGTGAKEGGDGTIQGSVKEGEAVVGTNVEYAAHVEYGTKFKQARSYMRAGFDKSIPIVAAIFKKHLQTGDK
ncbi:HK97 gp10 family phage protein [uncultured Sphaerochaeta sp.]|uniref:HK97 gp10 family phage protein n=1 Tax=uncultured Sphaerochaeta sp. TaxID=886478 RepID=UPI002A0A126F|nr:HK97 gp10 family phage protein [uncultured Sphaerochaeta sp.]